MVCNIVGCVVTKVLVEFSELPSGIYIVKFENQFNSNIFKITKE